MKLISLSSGSSGNCLYVEHENTKLLIDAGLSGNRIQQLMADASIDPSTLSAILVTHEHEDHIGGVGILSRRFQLPIYSNEVTMKAMRNRLGKLKEEHVCIFETNRSFCIKDISIHPFPTSHDASEPVGFQFSDGKSKLAIATDLGYVSDEIRANLIGCEAIFLESNHDVDMLNNGSYPYYLKKRILSNHGHLSNETASQFCCELIESGTQQFMFGHLSQQNNTPLLALKTAIAITEQHQMKRGEDFILNIAPRETISTEIFTIKK